MAYPSGKDGQLFLDGSGTEAARVKSWSLSASQDTIDTTFLGDTDRTFKEGVRSFSGNCEIAYYSDANGESDAKTLINKIFKPRTTSTEPGTAAEQGESTLKLGFSLAWQRPANRSSVGWRNRLGRSLLFSVALYFEISRKLGFAFRVHS